MIFSLGRIFEIFTFKWKWQPYIIEGFCCIGTDQNPLSNSHRIRYVRIELESDFKHLSIVGLQPFDPMHISINTAVYLRLLQQLLQFS